MGHLRLRSSEDGLTAARKAADAIVGGAIRPKRKEGGEGGRRAQLEGVTWER